METYYAWDDVPDNLKTKTQLSKEGLRLKKGQAAVAEFVSLYYKKEYNLYSVEDAVSKRKPSDAQLKVLEAARLKACTCNRCEKVFDQPLKICWPCQFYIQHQMPIAKAAANILKKNCIFLDTETTGLEHDDEIIEISIIDKDEVVLLDTLIRPKCRWIPKEAQAIHGITNRMVSNAPRWHEVHAQVARILQDTEVVVIYNVDYDRRLLKQTREKYNLPEFGFSSSKLYCAMLEFAEFHGDWNSYYKNWKWQKLGTAVNFFNIDLKGATAHRALADTIATLRVVKALSQDI